MPFGAKNESRFQGPPLPIAFAMDIARIKIITSRAILATGTLGFFDVQGPFCIT